MLCKDQRLSSVQSTIERAEECSAHPWLRWLTTHGPQHELAYLVHMQTLKFKYFNFKMNPFLWIWFIAPTYIHNSVWGAPKHPNSKIYTQLAEMTKNQGECCHSGTIAGGQQQIFQAALHICVWASTLNPTCLNLEMKHILELRQTESHSTFHIS